MSLLDKYLKIINEDWTNDLHNNAMEVARLLGLPKYHELGGGNPGFVCSCNNDPDKYLIFGWSNGPFGYDYMDKDNNVLASDNLDNAYTDDNSSSPIEQAEYLKEICKEYNCTLDNE